MSENALNPKPDFETFYERHWKDVYRLCFLYLKNEADAEDATEDVFVKVLRGHFVFQDEIHERKWLTVTAGNLCKDRLKSPARRFMDSLEDKNMPEIAAPQPEDYSYVREAVMALSPKLKEVVWLYYYEGYSGDEIASLLGRPPSTVRNQLKDAREWLKKRLEGDYP